MHEPICQPEAFALPVPLTRPKRRRSGGFTLFRLLAVIAAAGLLSALAAPVLFAGLP